MEFDELMEDSLQRIFNSKCNNYMIDGLSDEEVENAKTILENNEYLDVEYDDLTGESFKMNNVVIDLEKTKVNEIVKEVTSVLGKELDVSADFKELIKFYSYLIANDKRVQINFFNYDKLPIKEQKLVNNFFTITSGKLVIQVFFNRGKRFETLETTRTKDGHIYYLDRREDFNHTVVTHYTKNLTHRIKKEEKEVNNYGYM